MNITRIIRREISHRAYDGAECVWALCEVEGYFCSVWILLKVTS